MPVLDKVRRAMDEYGMTCPHDRVLVSVSGGPDSLALLVALHSLAAERRISLHVYTLDHGLRGAESAADAAFVAETAALLGLPCTVERADVGAEGFRRGQSLQAAARALRYERLATVAGAIGAQRIATGHNLEDQAETVLLRLLRGAGIRGLAGIPAVREGIYIRPLLGIPRAEIEAFLSERGLNPRRDPSNAKTVYLRNRIRLELLPYLEREYNPRLVETLAGMAERLRQDADYLDGLAGEAWSGLVESADGPAGSVTLDAAALMVQPPALISRIVHRAVAPLLAGSGRELTSSAMAAIVELMRREHNGAIDLGAGVVAVLTYGRLAFRQRLGRPVPLAPVLLPVPGQIEVVSLNIRVNTWLRTPSEPPPAVSADELGRAVFDGDRLPGAPTIRTRRPGDWLAPVGMTGTQKLQDLFVNCKVPRHQRDAVPVLVAGQDILWVMGYRLDRRFSLPPGKAAEVNCSKLLWVCYAPAP